MKKSSTKFLSLFLCFLMIFTALPVNVPTIRATETVPVNVSENTVEETAEKAPASVSENIVRETTVSNNDTAEEDKVHLTFYDDDRTTVLYTFSMPKDTINLYKALDDISEIPMIKKGYPIYRWDCPQRDRKYLTTYIYNTLTLKVDHSFYAIWDEDPYDFTIDYQLAGGSFADDSDIPYDFNVESETIRLPLPQRKGYKFNGWYTDSAYKNKVDTIPAGTYIDTVVNGEIAPYTLYAKWTACKPAKASKPKAKNSSTGKIAVTFSSVAGAEGYELVYATSKNFKSNKMTRDLGTKTKFTLSNLKKGQKYFFKVRAYATDSTGKKCYGSYSSSVSCKVTKGVKEYTAKKNSGTLKKVVVKNGTDLYVQAKVSKRLKSSDNFYYLVKVDPNTEKVLKQIAKTDKTTTVKFQLPLKDEKGNNHIQGKYGVAVKKGKKYMLITKTSFINNPETAASYTAPFPKPASKKGRQGVYNTALGDKNYFTNFNLNTMIGTKSYHNVAYKYNGKTYYFLYPNLGSVAQANKDGGTVTVQVMLQYADHTKDLILKSGRAPGANYYAFNTDQKAAREKLEAAFHFLAEYASQEGYHVDNWILGNEVNTYANMNAKWYYAGNISRDKFMKNYASTFRMLYYAVKSNNKNARVYICCDHTWINRENDWGTKYFTKAFNDEIKKQNKKIKWNLAYHAYSAVLTNADFWNDGSLAPNNDNADFVSPKNLEILTDYVKENFGKDTRIILSEQGFSCSGGVGSPYNNGRQTGEGVQAAAVAWLYYKAQFNDMIDAVIFSSGDHGGAGYQFDFIGRKAENVYKYMDTPKYATYTKDCLKTIGKSSWKNAVKGFNAKTLKKMPTR